jgi:hypothetical protein
VIKGGSRLGHRPAAHRDHHPDPCGPAAGRDPDCPAAPPAGWSSTRAVVVDQPPPAQTAAGLTPRCWVERLPKQIEDHI